MKAKAEQTARRYAPVFKALADPTRQKIMLMLEGRPRTVSEVVDFFNLSQPTISRHLAVLKNAGLVEAEKKGQNVFYRLSEPNLKACCVGFFSSFACCQPVVVDMVERNAK
ncbi:MAG: metalloregulator ArsR/SmtB family transcription factor [Limisphaerales bacterium]